MSAVVTAEREDTAGAAVRHEQRLFDDGFTLDDRVVAIWTELTDSGSAQCPVCGGALRAAGCDDCGSRLS